MMWEPPKSKFNVGDRVCTVDRDTRECGVVQGIRPTLDIIVKLDGKKGLTVFPERVLIHEEDIPFEDDPFVDVS